MLSKAKSNQRVHRVSSRARSGSRDRAFVRAREKANPTQAEILMIANDAALTGQYDRAIAILALGKSRTIATAYKATTPESALRCEFADRGWKKDESIEVCTFDIEEQHAAGSDSPVTLAIVKQTIRWLRYGHADRTSSDSYEPDVSYLSPFEVSNAYKGEEEAEEFSLCNFTPEEERLVFDAFVRWRRDVKAEVLLRYRQQPR